MQMSYSYASDFPFKTFANSLKMEKQYEKKCLRAQTAINHISILTFLCFLPQYQRQRKCVFFRARAEKGIARHIDASSVVWTLVIFDWFVLSMRMQVILDSLFARPGSAPIRGGKKGEFRDWTTFYLTYSSHKLIDYNMYKLQLPACLQPPADMNTLLLYLEAHIGCLCPSVLTLRYFFLFLKY